MKNQNLPTKLLSIALALAFIIALFPAARAESYEAEVNVNRMVVRSGPTTAYGILGYLNKGTRVTVLATSGKIAKISYKGKTGYSLLSQLTPVEKPTPTPTATANTDSGSLSGLGTITSATANVYASASASSNVLMVAKQGQTFTVLATNGSWARLQNGSSIGYVKMSQLNIRVGVTATPAPGSVTTTPTPTASAVPTPTPTGLAYIKQDKTKIYASYSTNSNVIAVMNRGADFTILDMNDNWVKLENGKNVGFVERKDVNIVPGVTATPKAGSATPTPTPKPTPTPTPSTATNQNIPAFANCSVPLYKSPSTASEKIRTLSMGQELTVWGWNGAWAAVIVSGTKGYTSLSALTKVSDVTLQPAMRAEAQVSASRVTFYKYASSSSKTVGSLTSGSEVTVLATNGTWALVEYRGNRGYCTASSLSAITNPTLEQTENISALTNKKTKVYAYATTSSDTLATLNQDTFLTLLGHNGQWGLIDCNGHKGYVDINSLVRYSSVTLNEDERYQATVTVAGSVKKYAYDASTGAGSVSAGMKVNVLAHNTYWALIERNGHKGYYPVTGLKIHLDEFISPTEMTFEATVICAAPAYAAALESANRLGTIPIATNVTVTAYTDKWARISYSGVTAYLLRNTLSATDYIELKNGVSAANQILALQKKLEDLGYFDGLPAGNYGSLTTNAVSRFQNQIGLSASGVADKTTQRVLYGGHAPQSSIKTANLSKGSVGSDVTRLQTRLTYKGYLSAGIDGDFGNITLSAVKLYQKKAGLEETGVADPATLSSLFSSSAPKNTGAAVSGSGSSSSGGSASTGNYSTNPNDDPASGTGSSNIETVVTHALQQLGKPYIYATSGPNSFDCSGFTSYCYRKIGISLGRSAYAQGYGRGTKIESVSAMKRGDIVCMNTITDSDLSDHVGIYLGGGKFIHASSAAGKVIISSITTGYYNRVFSWARRIV